MKFLENLTALLEKYKMSRNQLAIAINISPSTITLWYRGNYEKINLDTIMKIADYFCISVEELVNGDLTTISFSLKDFSIAELHSIQKYSEFLKEQRTLLKSEEVKNDN